MDILNDDAVARLFSVWRRYLPAIYGIILSIPVLFYLLVVRSQAIDLVYTFRISNSTDLFFYDVQVKSDYEFRCAVLPKSESKLFTMKIRRSWFEDTKLIVTVRHYGDSSSINHVGSSIVLQVGNNVRPDRLNRICIMPEVPPDTFVVSIE